MKADAGVPVRNWGSSASRVAVIVALSVEKRALMRPRSEAASWPIQVIQSGPGPAAAALAVSGLPRR